jgi:hypothetical protein
MDVGAIFLILALSMVVVAFVARPFFPRAVRNHSPEKGPATVKAEHEQSALLAQRDRLISALQELDFDYALGKIPGEDYTERRNALRTEAAQVLRKLDEITPGIVKAEGGTGEAEAVMNVDDELEEMIVARRQAKRELAGGFCPQCGKAVLKTDKFCSHCGSLISKA